MAQLVTQRPETTGGLTWISQQWQQPIQRIFWLHGVPAHQVRGGHRHQADCQMVLHCVAGQVKIYVQTPNQDHTYRLQAGDQYLFLDGDDWRLMYDFSPDAVLLVVASKLFETTLYQEEPYRCACGVLRKLGYI